MIPFLTEVLGLAVALVVLVSAVPFQKKRNDYAFCIIGEVK